MAAGSSVLVGAGVVEAGSSVLVGAGVVEAGSSVLVGAGVVAALHVRFPTMAMNLSLSNTLRCAHNFRRTCLCSADHDSLCGSRSGGSRLLCAGGSRRGGSRQLCAGGSRSGCGTARQVAHDGHSTSRSFCTRVCGRHGCVQQAMTHFVGAGVVAAGSSVLAGFGIGQLHQAGQHFSQARDEYGKAIPDTKARATLAEQHSLITVTKLMCHQ